MDEHSAITQWWCILRLGTYFIMKTHQLGFFYRHRESVTEDELDLICKTLSLACIQPSVAPLLVLLTTGVTICGFLTQLYECQHHHLICKVYDCYRCQTSHQDFYNFVLANLFQLIRNSDEPFWNWKRCSFPSSQLIDSEFRCRLLWRLSGPWEVYDKGSSTQLDHFVLAGLTKPKTAAFRWWLEAASCFRLCACFTHQSLWALPTPIRHHQVMMTKYYSQNIVNKRLTL